MQPLERETSISGGSDVLLPRAGECPPFEITVEHAPVGIGHFDHSGRFLFVNPGTMRGIFPLYARYYRPGFHPNQIESAYLVEKWVREEAERAAA